MPADDDIIVLVELQVNRCGLVYGQAPCTATGSPGFECYNTFNTCQDKANYLPVASKIYLETQNAVSRIQDDDSDRFTLPILTGFPRYTSTQLKRGDGVAVRGGVQIQAMDFTGPAYSKPDYIDPYIDTREQSNGTFWNRFRSLWPYTNRSVLRIISQKNSPGAVQHVQEYRLESIQGPDPTGKVVLKGRDVLTAIDQDQAQTPLADTAELDSAINASQTTITITGLNPFAWPDSGAFICEDELIFYAAINRGTGQLTGCVRGYGNSEAASHDAGTECQPSRLFEDMNICDVLYELLTVDAGIDPGNIPYTQGVDPTAQWDAERTAWLEGYTINKAVLQPTGVARLLDELCEQAHVNLWYIPELQEIWISATNTGVAGQSAIPITDSIHMLAGSVKMVEREKRMISQAWAYYNPINMVESGSPRDYGDVDIQVNTELESVNAWGQKRVSSFLGSWLYAAGNIALVTNQRIISERSLPQYEITFQTDYSTLLYVGTFINLRTDYFQAPDGTPLEWTWQIIKARDVIPTARREYVAASVRPLITTLRFANITNVANEGVEYGNATPADRDLWGWIAALDGFNNGDEPYLIQ